MTLQNDPPSLESVSEYEDQYKSYGKSIRKIIVDCLQKDPTKRPTASELLKYSFIKKAKDRRYLMQTLLPSTPSFAERSRRALDAKRGSSLDSGGNGESGSWVWPQEENGGGGIMDICHELETPHQIIDSDVYIKPPEQSTPASTVGLVVNNNNGDSSGQSSESPSSMTDGITTSTSVKSNGDTSAEGSTENSYQQHDNRDRPTKRFQVRQRSKSFDSFNDNQSTRGANDNSTDLKKLL